eukprot:1525700-Rhodomonas_salina.1
MGPDQFDKVVKLIEESGAMRESVIHRFGQENVIIPVAFKIAASVFWMGHGGGYMPAATAAGIAVSTLRKYLTQTAASIILAMKPIYMP